MSSLCLAGVRVTLVFFVPRAWGHGWTRVICRCPTRQWMSTEKMGSMFLLCWRRQQDNNVPLCLSEKQVCVVPSGFIHSTSYVLRFNTFPDHAEECDMKSDIPWHGAHQLSWPGWETVQSCAAERKRQSRCSWLCGRELASCFILPGVFLNT